MSNQHCAKGLDCGILGNHTHPDVVGVQRGIAVGEANVTPNPVPSEVAETTAGEGEVEALAEAVWNAMPAHHVGWRGLKGDSRDFYLGIAERLMPTLDRVRREEGERIAQAIEAACDLPETPCRWCRSGIAIARAASVGRGEGL